MVNVLIKSYAHAKSLGIEPCDSIIDTVIEKKSKPPYRIVGHTQGHTYRSGDKVYASKMKEYEIVVPSGDYSLRIYATTPAVAKVLAKNHLRQGVRFTVYEEKVHRRRV